MSTEIKITGTNQIVTLSPKGDLVAIGGYDGSFKIYDTQSQKLIFKDKVKGSVREVPIFKQGFSFDSRFYAFSCLHKVFIVDLIESKIIKEIVFDEKERMYSISFAFFHNSNKLIIPDGYKLIVYDIDLNVADHFELFEGAGSTKDLVISKDDKYFAYKSSNHSICDKQYIYDFEKKEVKTIIELPYEYIPGQQMFESYAKFISTDEIAIMRIENRISYFNFKTGELVKELLFSSLDYKLANFSKMKISNKGNIVLLGLDEQQQLGNYLLFDLEKQMEVYKNKLDCLNCDFSIENNLIVQIKRIWLKGTQKNEFLTIDKIY